MIQKTKKTHLTTHSVKLRKLMLWQNVTNLLKDTFELAKGTILRMDVGILWCKKLFLRKVKFKILIHKI